MWCSQGGRPSGSRVRQDGAATGKRAWAGAEFDCILVAVARRPLRRRGGSAGVRPVLQCWRPGADQGLRPEKPESPDGDASLARSLPLRRSAEPAVLATLSGIPYELGQQQFQRAGNSSEAEKVKRRRRGSVVMTTDMPTALTGRRRADGRRGLGVALQRAAGDSHFEALTHLGRAIVPRLSLSRPQDSSLTLVEPASRP